MFTSRKYATILSKIGQSLAMALLFITLLPSCRPEATTWEPEPEKPANLLSEEAMVAVLVDVHLAEGDNQEKALTLEDQRVLLKQHYSKIASYHDVTMNQLLESYEYYSQKPLTMHAMYEKVIEELVKLESEFN